MRSLAIWPSLPWILRFAQDDKPGLKTLPSAHQRKLVVSLIALYFFALSASLPEPILRFASPSPHCRAPSGLQLSPVVHGRVTRQVQPNDDRPGQSNQDQKHFDSNGESSTHRRALPAGPPPRAAAPRFCDPPHTRPTPHPDPPP